MHPIGTSARTFTLPHPRARPIQNEYMSLGHHGHIEVDALGGTTISRGCFQRSFSNKKTSPYRSNLSFVTLRTPWPTLLPCLRAPYAVLGMRSTVHIRARPIHRRSHPPGCGRWYAPSSRHLRALLSVCGGCLFGGLVCCSCCVCVSVSGALFSVGVCLCVTC